MVGRPGGASGAGAALGRGADGGHRRDNGGGASQGRAGGDGGRGADVTIEATGSPGAVAEGMRLTRDAGTFVVAGQYTDAGDVTLNPHADLNKKHLDVRATWGVDSRTCGAACGCWSGTATTYWWEDLLTKVYPLAAADQALDDVAAGRVIKAAIDPWA